MVTEKDIRTFVRANAPKPTDNDKFMEELRQSIVLLPEPASLCGVERDVESEIRLVRELARAVRRKNLRIALATTAAVLVAAVPVILLCAKHPVIHETLSAYSTYIYAAIATAALAVAFSKTKHIF